MNRDERNLYELYFKKIVIEHIRDARIAKGWTHAQLADAIDVSHEFVRSLESLKGKNTFSAFTAWRISKALNVSLDDLLEFDMEQFRPIIEKAMREKIS